MNTETPLLLRPSSVGRYVVMMLVALLSTVLWQVPQASTSTLFGDVIRADDSSPDNAYGYSLSVSGDTAAVGAWFDEGAVYILAPDTDTGNWRQIQKIETPAIAANKGNFGFSVWLDNNQLVVGAPNILLSGPDAVTGFAFFYERNTADGLWNLVSSVEGLTNAPGEFSAPGSLGREVVVHQGRAAVAQDNEDDFSTVKMYEQDAITGSWLQTEELRLDDLDNVNPDRDSADFTISSLAMDNNRLAVGHTYRNSADVQVASLHTYEYNDAQGRWIKSESTDAFDAIESLGTFFGLTLDNDNLLVTGDSGAFLFQYRQGSNQWVQDVDFSTDVMINVSQERMASDIEGSRIVIADADGVGATVYEQNTTSGRWNEFAQLSTSLVGTEGATVTSLDLAGDHILVGTPYIEGFTGAVVAYRLDDFDSDGIAAEDDNCPADYNPAQIDTDQDLLGDVCDLDDDNDGVDDTNDAFPLDPTRQDAPADSETGTAPIVPRPAMPIGSGIALETDFRWPTVPNASFYIIEVQHDGLIRAYEPTISATSACTDSQCTYIKSDAALEGANRWRLRAGNETGISEWSAWVDFFVNQPAEPIGESGNSGDSTQAPSIPVPQQPDGDINRVADYYWTAVPDAITYSIEVQHMGSIRAYEPSIPASAACVADQCRYTKSDAAKIGENRWRVRAINLIGASSWSDWVSFTVTETAIDFTTGLPVSDYR